MRASNRLRVRTGVRVAKYGLCALVTAAWIGLGLWFYLASPMRIGSHTVDLPPGTYCTGACPGPHKTVPFAVFVLAMIPVASGLVALGMLNAVSFQEPRWKPRPLKFVTILIATTSLLAGPYSFTFWWEYWR